MRGERRRFALLLALVAVGAGAAGCSNDAATSSGGAGTGGSSGGSNDAGAGGSPIPNCQLEITPQLPPSFTGLTAGPGVKLRVRGEITGQPGAIYQWRWSVWFADGSTVQHVLPHSTDDAVIEFPLALPGSYTMTATLTGSSPPCGGERTVVVPHPSGKLASFRFRFVPPPNSDPPQERELQVLGGTPSGGNRIALAAGAIIPVRLHHRDQQTAIAAYVRVTTAGRPVVAAEAHTTATGGAPTLSLPPGQYDLLIVPDGDVAPVFLAGIQLAQLAALMPMALEPGAIVSGRVTSAAGPVGGAKVVLRAGVLPSSLGVTDRTGAFTVRARPGTYGMTVSLDEGDGKTMETLLPPTPGIAVDGATAPGALDVVMAPFTPSALALNLVASDGIAPAAASRVVVESAAPLDGLAGVKVGSVMRAATVKVRGQLVPTATGALVMSGLPPARYRATVFPTASSSGDAVTSVADLDLSGGTMTARTVTLKRKVTLTGKLLPGAQAGGIAITAVDLLGDFPIAIPGAADDAGVWSLQVNPERTYALRAQPQPGRMLARTLFGPVLVRATDLLVADQKMPPALLYAGTVVNHSLQGIGGALIQVFCPVSGPDCADTETPIAETATRSDGYFQLLLPDPGTNP